MEKTRSVLFVLLAGILWGIISIFVTGLSRAGLSSAEISFMRITVCAALMFVFLLVYDRKLLYIKLKDIWMFIGTGIISLTLFSFCYFTTILRTEASIAVSLLYTSPVFLMLFSAVLFHEKITARKVAAIVMTVFGCAFVSGIVGAKKIEASSLAIGICAGLFYALYSVFARYALAKYKPFTITFYTFLFSSFGFLFLVKPSGLKHLSTISGRTFLIAAALGFFCGILPYLFYTEGLKKLDVSVAGGLVAVEPLVGALVGIVGFKENAEPIKLLGIVLILSSIVILSLPEKLKSKRKSSAKC